MYGEQEGPPHTKLVNDPESTSHDSNSGDLRDWGVGLSNREEILDHSKSYKLNLRAGRLFFSERKPENMGRTPGTRHSLKNIDENQNKYL